LFIAGKTQKGLAHLRREKRRQGPTFWRLDSHGVNARGFGIVPHSIEEYGLSNPAKAHHQNALVRPPESQSFNRNTHGFSKFSPAG
jgi:hypothetical protein